MNRYRTVPSATANLNKRSIIITYEGHKWEDREKHTRCIGRIGILAG